MNCSLNWESLHGLSKKWIFRFHPQCQLCWCAHSGVRVFVSFHHCHGGAVRIRKDSLSIRSIRMYCMHSLFCLVSKSNWSTERGWRKQTLHEKMTKRKKSCSPCSWSLLCMPQSTVKVLRQGPSNAPLHCACVVHGMSTANARTNGFRTHRETASFKIRKVHCAVVGATLRLASTQWKFVHQITWVNPFAGSGSCTACTTRRSTNLNYELSFTIRSTDSHSAHSIANDAYAVFAEFN